MSIKETIRDLEKIEGCCQPGSAWRETIGDAIALLKTHPDNRPNEPLTLEALRGMSGLPVWVESPGVDREISGRWVIVDWVGLNTKTLFTRGNDFTCHDYGTVWVAYRRPPKEETP